MCMRYATVKLRTQRVSVLKKNIPAMNSRDNISYYLVKNRLQFTFNIIASIPLF